MAADCAGSAISCLRSVLYDDDPAPDHWQFPPGPVPFPGSSAALRPEGNRPCAASGGYPHRDRLLMLYPTHEADCLCKHAHKSVWKYALLLFATASLRKTQVFRDAVLGTFNRSAYASAKEKRAGRPGCFLPLPVCSLYMPSATFFRLPSALLFLFLPQLQNLRCRGLPEGMRPVFSYFVSFSTATSMRRRDSSRPSR